MPFQPSSSVSLLVLEYARLLRQPIDEPVIAPVPLSTELPALDCSRPCALILAPHPDDECLVGTLPIRLLCERGWQIVVVALTLGSKKARQEGRKNELAKACAVTGFSAVLLENIGGGGVNPSAREADPELWHVKAKRLAHIFAQTAPRAVFMPHAADWNATHIGAHLLGRDALALMPTEFETTVVETEYWGAMSEPNLMVEAGENDIAVLLSGLACHCGEMARNPFDKCFPARLIDNVRRGSEVLQGMGADEASMNFAEIYRIGRWARGKFTPSALKRLIGMDESLDALFE